MPVACWWRCRKMKKKNYTGRRRSVAVVVAFVLYMTQSGDGTGAGGGLYVSREFCFVVLGGGDGKGRRAKFYCA